MTEAAKPPDAPTRFEYEALLVSFVYLQRMLKNYELATGRTRMRKFYIFTKHPMYQLDYFAETERERDEKLRSWKETYPEVSVFWIEVNQA